MFLLFFVVCAAAAAGVSLYDAEMMSGTYVALQGDSIIELEVGQEYVEQGCMAKYGTEIVGFKEIEYNVSGAVDTQTLGSYEVLYTAAYSGTAAEAKRTVKVVDTTPPVITCAELIKVYEGTTAFPLEYTATDLVDGDLTATVIKEDLEASVRLTVADKSGNVTVREIPVEFMKDVTAPKITLSGLGKIFLRQGAAYVEPGYSATDNRDGKITDKVVVSGGVDTSVCGEHVITYTATDESGNTGTATRSVWVYKLPADGDTVSSSVIYLTFDDGPGKYTERLLNTLKSYNVRATFFVTNQFPNYQNLIGAAHRDGHAIAVHTYSHNWNIYNSVDNFMADFNAMNQIIFEQTGDYSRIFRFPGGTSNEVSKSRCAGIMTRLSQLMPEAGYRGYDWNVDSNDTSLSRPEQVANRVISGLKRNRNNIVLMHDIKAHTVNAVPAIIEYGLAHGYSFSVITEDTPVVQLPVAN